MPIFSSSNKLRILMITVALALGACGDKSTALPAGDVAGSVGQAPPTTAANHAAHPKFDYWKPISALLAGTYGGQCRQIPEYKSATGAVLVGTDGKVSAPNFSESLLQARTVMIMRNATMPGVPFSMVADGDGFNIVLGYGGPGSGNTASVHKGESGLLCETGKHSSTLASKNFYSVYAAALDRAPIKLRCAKLGEVIFTEYGYQVGQGILKLGEETFDLTKLSSETLYIGDRFNALSFNGETQDKRLIIIHLNEFGMVQEVKTRDKNDHFVFCHREPK